MVSSTYGAVLVLNGVHACRFSSQGWGPYMALSWSRVGSINNAFLVESGANAWRSPDQGGTVYGITLGLAAHAGTQKAAMALFS